jgi:hypothetical protein
VVGEAPAPVLLLGEAVGLDHGPHRAVQHEDALLQRGPKPLQPGRPLFADGVFENHVPLF